MKLLSLLTLSLALAGTQAQLIRNVANWFSSFTEPPPQVKVIRYGDWTSAPSTTTRRTREGTTPSSGQDARNIGLSVSTTAETSTPGSLFDRLSPGSEEEEIPVIVPEQTSPPVTTSTSTTSTDRPPSLFDHTEIFFQNFTTKQEFKPLFQKEKPHSMKDRLPKIPDKFKEVLINHTNTNTEPESLFDSVEEEEEEEEDDSMSSSDDNTFTVSRPDGSIDTSLIINKENSHQARELVEETKLFDETNSRFGMSRPKIRGFALREIERSSNQKPSLQRPKYSFLKNKMKKEMNIEEILEASNARKRFDLSKRLKPKTPIYIKKHKESFKPDNIYRDTSEKRDSRQQDNEWEGILPLPFKTGQIFDSKTGEILQFELGRSLELPEQNDDGEEIIEQENENTDSELAIELSVEKVIDEEDEVETNDQSEAVIINDDIFPNMETNEDPTEPPEEETTSGALPTAMEEDFLSDVDVELVEDESEDDTTDPPVTEEEEAAKPVAGVSRFRLPVKAGGQYNPVLALPLLTYRPLTRYIPHHPLYPRLTPRLTGLYPRMMVQDRRVPINNNFRRLLFI